MLASLTTLLALLGQPGEAEALVVLAVATSFGWSAVARSMLASRRLDEGRRAKLLRRVCTGQVACVLCFWSLLMVLAHLWPAAAVLVVGIGLAMLSWPWRWRLAQAADDRGRVRDPDLGRQHVMAAGILLVLAVGSAIALGMVAAVLLVALFVSSLTDAWDERRRPRSAPASTPGAQREPAIVPTGARLARAWTPVPFERAVRTVLGGSARTEVASTTAHDAAVKLDATVGSPSPAEREAAATLPVQRHFESIAANGNGRDRDDRRQGARRRENSPRASQRRGGERRAQTRYSGRRVASRRS